MAVGRRRALPRADRAAADGRQRGHREGDEGGVREGRADGREDRDGRRGRSHRRRSKKGPGGAGGHPQGRRPDDRPDRRSRTGTSSPARSTSPTSRPTSSSPFPASRSGSSPRSSPHDQTRMLTLLKVDAKDLPVPDGVPQEGRGGRAVGARAGPHARTRHRPPAVDEHRHRQRRQPHLGQGDPDRRQDLADELRRAARRRSTAACSASSCRRRTGPRARRPASSGTTAGSASPSRSRTSCASLPRLKEGKDLRRGLLGITPQGTDVYNAPPVIGAIQPDSAAARAGLKVGDTDRRDQRQGDPELLDAPARARAAVRGRRDRGQGEARRQGAWSSRSIKLHGTVTGLRQRVPRHPAHARRSRSRASRCATSTRRARPTSRA